ncbi:MAG: response regulator [Actinomycetota bacterium]|nr:response regulator [Actinomycetota bacterium]
MVEDIEDNLTLIDYLLRAYGYTPLLARNGLDGIRIAKEAGPEVILLDLRMPGLDGYEVVRQIRRIPAMARTRVVALTASAMIGDRERIAAAGFDGYIQKPIDPHTFAASLERLLNPCP